METNLISPFIKWVGGKRQLLPEIKKLIPSNYNRYYEPFVGGGAVLFDIQPKQAVINDINKELINVYQVIKLAPKKLIAELRKHKNTPEHFYKIRALDKEKKFEALSTIKRAARVIYLNKTCYNGLYRVNGSGYFNSPFGSYKNPNIINETVIQAVSEYLNTHEITIYNKDFKEVIAKILEDAENIGNAKGVFVYFDPPYCPVSKSANFTNYTKTGFTLDHQYQLKKACDKLDKKNVKFLLSNSATSLIKDLYKAYHVKVVKANRAINSDGRKRGQVNEVLIRNYE